MALAQHEASKLQMMWRRESPLASVSVSADQLNKACTTFLVATSGPLTVPSNFQQFVLLLGGGTICISTSLAIPMKGKCDRLCLRLLSV